MDESERRRQITGGDAELEAIWEWLHGPQKIWMPDMCDRHRGRDVELVEPLPCYL